MGRRVQWIVAIDALSIGGGHEMGRGEFASSIVQDCYEFGENAVADITRRSLGH